MIYNKSCSAIVAVKGRGHYYWFREDKLSEPMVANATATWALTSLVPLEVVMLESESVKQRFKSLDSEKCSQEYTGKEGQVREWAFL